MRIFIVLFYQQRAPNENVHLLYVYRDDETPEDQTSQRAPEISRPEGKISATEGKVPGETLVSGLPANIYN